MLSNPNLGSFASQMSLQHVQEAKKDGQLCHLVDRSHHYILTDHLMLCWHRPWNLNALEMLWIKDIYANKDNMFESVNVLFFNLLLHSIYINFEGLQQNPEIKWDPDSFDQNALFLLIGPYSVGMISHLSVAGTIFHDPQHLLAHLFSPWVPFNLLSNI